MLNFIELYNTIKSDVMVSEFPYRFLISVSVCVCAFRAMASSGAKEQFLRQMEQIVEGIKQSRIKVHGKNFILLKIKIWLTLWLVFSV